MSSHLSSEAAERSAVDAVQQRFTHLYEVHYPSILAYFMRRLDSTVTAQDLTEDVFLVAWRKLDQIPAGEESRYWLYGVARRTLMNHQRKTSTRRRLLPRIQAAAYNDTPGPETQLVRSEEARALLGALATLKEDDQELIRLAYWDELPHQAIAALLGCSRGAIDVRLHRAVKRLGKAMAHSRHIPIEEIAMRSRQEPQC